MRTGHMLLGGVFSQSTDFMKEESCTHKWPHSGRCRIYTCGAEVAERRRRLLWNR